MMIMMMMACRWLGPWMRFWLGDGWFLALVKVAGALDGVLAG
jgi:hypothetical protein